MRALPGIPVQGIAFNTVLSFLARFFGIALGFFALGITTRFLGEEGFGVYSTVAAYAYIFSFVADLGLYSLMVREISRAESPAQERSIASNIFTLRLFALACVLFLGFILSFLFSSWYALPKAALLLASFQYLFLSLSQVLVGIFQKHLQIRFLAIAELFGRGVTLVLLLLFLWQAEHLGVSPVVLALSAFTLGSLAIVSVSFWGAGRLVPGLTLRVDVSLWRQFFRETLPLGIAVVLTALYFRLDTLFLAFFRSSGEVGLYNAAYRILEVLIFFPSAFVGLLMPQLSRFATSLNSNFHRVFRGGLEVLILITFPIAIGLFFEAHPIVTLIAGNEFSSGGGALRILSGAVFMIFFAALFSNALIAKKQQKRLAWIYFWGALFNVFSNALIIPRFGFLGAAFTTLLTEFLVTVLMVFVLYERGLFTLSFVRVRATCIASILLALFLMFTQFPLFVTVLLGALIYGLFLFSFGGFSQKDLAFFLEKGT